jgi:hypothetical protein
MAQHWPLGHLVPAKTHDCRLHGAQDWRSSQVKSIPCGAEKPPKITQVLWGNGSPSFWRELVPRRKDIARGPGTTGRLGTGAANQRSTVTKKGDEGLSKHNATNFPCFIMMFPWKSMKSCINWYINWQIHPCLNKAMLPSAKRILTWCLRWKKS